MSFISSFFLWGSLLMTVPVIIHLIARRQRKVLPWGAMQLLQSTSIVKKQKRFRLKDLFILLLRMLIVLLFSFLFARPFIALPWSQDHQTQLLIVIDDSLSMSRQYDGSKSYFEEAKTRAAEIIHHKSNAVDKKVFLSSSSLISIDLNELENAKARNGYNNMIQQLTSLCSLPQQDDLDHLQIVVITDDAEHSWPKEQRGQLAALKEGLLKQNKKIDLQMMPLGLSSDRPIHNLALGEMEFQSNLFRKGVSYFVNVVVTNHGEATLENQPYEWRLNHHIIGKNKIDKIKPGQSINLNFNFEIKNKGSHTLTCELSLHDDLKLDNTSRVVLQVEEQLPILIVTNQEWKNRGPLNDLSYLLAALGYMGEDRSGSKNLNLYQPTICTTKTIAEQNFRKYEAIILLDMDQIPDTQKQKLLSYLNSGRGVWVVPGNSIDLETFNQNYHKISSLLSPYELKSIEKVSGDREKKHEVLFEQHPALASLTNNETFDSQKINLTKFFEVDRVGKFNCNHIMTSSFDSPLLTEHSVLNGKVLCQYFGFNKEWSDFSLNPFFVTYLHEILNYLISPNRKKMAYAFGDSLRWESTDGKIIKDCEIVTPNQEQIKLNKFGESFIFFGTHTFGLYKAKLTFEDGTFLEEEFYVTKPHEESNLNKLSQKDLQQLKDSKVIKFVDGFVEFTPTTKNNPTQEPIDQWLGFILLCLVLFEFIFAIRMIRKRPIKAHPHELGV